MRKIILNITAAAFLLPGCASIMTGKNQTIPLATKPSGASVRIVNTRNLTVFEGTTPCEVKALKQDLVYSRVTFSKDGYEPVTFTMGSRIEPTIVGNVCCIAGWFVGALYDVLNGAYLKADPETLTIELKPSGKPASFVSADTQKIILSVSAVTDVDGNCTLVFSDL